MSDGLCQCGCGQKTSIAQRRNTKFGHVKGEPVRFLYGHHRRKSPHRFLVEDRGYKTPCHVWQGGLTTEFGYALDWDPVAKKKVLGHHATWIAKNGPIPSGLDLNHLCRVHPCINPDHLEPVTRAVSIQRGKNTKLTRDDVLWIRDAYAQGCWTLKELGKLYGVSGAHVHCIVSRKTWKNV